MRRRSISNARGSIWRIWPKTCGTTERPAESALDRTHADARLTLQRDGVDSHCFADSVRIGQVFRNLFENALAACGDPCK